MNDKNYRRMLISTLIQFAHSDSDMELVSVFEGENTTNVRFELKRPMRFITDDPASWTERRIVNVNLGVE